MGLFLHRAFHHQQHRHRERVANGGPDPRPHPAGPLLRLRLDIAGGLKSLRLHVGGGHRPLPSAQRDRRGAAVHSPRGVELRLDPAQREPGRAFDLQHPRAANDDRPTRLAARLFSALLDAAFPSRRGRRSRLQRRGLERRPHRPRQRHPERQRLQAQRAADDTFRRDLPGGAGTGHQQLGRAAARWGWQPDRRALHLVGCGKAHRADRRPLRAGRIQTDAAADAQRRPALRRPRRIRHPPTSSAPARRSSTHRYPPP